jgi:hypothetical protein
MGLSAGQADTKLALLTRLRATGWAANRQRRVPSDFHFLNIATSQSSGLFNFDHCIFPAFSAPNSLLTRLESLLLACKPSAPPANTVCKVSNFAQLRTEHKRHTPVSAPISKVTHSAFM